MSYQVPVSAVVFTLNEEKNIEKCLKSIASWCQQIFVVDSGSTDKTLEICSRYTNLIFPHPYVDHTSQWDWALKNLPFACDWIMPLDADHVVTDGLRRDIEKVLLNLKPGVSGYYSRHRYFFRGVSIRGFKPYGISLFLLSKTSMDQSELVDFRFLIKGKIEKMAGAVHEINQNESSIDFWTDKHQKFSSRVAVEEVLRVNGYVGWSMQPRLLGNPDERIIWLKNYWIRLPLYIRPFLYFIYRYFIRLGFLDGRMGFIYHILQAFWYRLLIDIKIAELRQQLSEGELSLEQLRAEWGHQHSEKNTSERRLI